MQLSIAGINSTSPTSLRCLNLEDLREQNGEFQLIRGLTEDRFVAICALLECQSSADVKAFETGVNRLLQSGYELTSLVADLRSPAQAGVLREWRCEVRPKIGAVKTHAKYADPRRRSIRVRR